MRNKYLPVQRRSLMSKIDIFKLQIKTEIGFDPIFCQTSFFYAKLVLEIDLINQFKK